MLVTATASVLNDVLNLHCRSVYSLQLNATDNSNQLRVFDKFGG